MLADLREHAQDMADGAAGQWRRLRNQPLFHSPPQKCAVRSAGMLLLAASGVAAAWLAYRAAIAMKATPTPKTEDDYDNVDEASMESFPASDPPSFSPGAA